LVNNDSNIILEKKDSNGGSDVHGTANSSTKNFKPINGILVGDEKADQIVTACLIENYIEKNVIYV